MADALFREFTSELFKFGDEDVEGRGTAMFRECAQVTAEAIVIGNAYGPGTPLDTGWLRASFRVSESVPEDGPGERPALPGREPGSGTVFASALDTSAAARAKLGNSVFVSTMAPYAGDLEEGAGLVRRNGPPENIGAPTPFIAPVEARFGQIAEDAARRVGYGS